MAFGIALTSELGMVTVTDVFLGLWDRGLSTTGDRQGSMDQAGSGHSDNQSIQGWTFLLWNFPAAILSCRVHLSQLHRSQSTICSVLPRRTMSGSAGTCSQDTGTRPSSPLLFLMLFCDE